MATKPIKREKESVADETIHVGLTTEQKKKLDTMAATDRRKLADFVRVLIEDEWDERQLHIPTKAPEVPAS